MFANIKKYGVLFGCFLAPVVILLLVYAKIQIHPFGSKSLLMLDLRQQYVEFFSYYRDILAGNHSLFYTFSKNLGGGMFDFFAYYLASPLNLVFALFPKEAHLTAILTATLLKIGFCGLTFGIYAKRAFKMDPLAVVIFSAFYALNGYNLAYQSNLMWLDSVILLPLAALGTDRLMQEKAPALFVFSLTALIVTQYYLAWMTGVFLVLYFLYRLGLANFREAGRRSLRWLASVLLSVGIGAVIWLPAWNAYRDGGKMIDFANIKFAEKFSAPDLLSKLYVGAFDYSKILVTDALPYVFCGTFAVLLTVCYFRRRNVRIAHKVWTGFLIGIPVAGMSVDPLNLIWHGLEQPGSFAFRCAFALSFALIVTGCRMMEELDAVSLRDVVFSVAVLTAAAWFVEKGAYSHLSSLKVFETVLFLFLYGSLTLLMIVFNNRKALLIAGLVLAFAELSVNSGQVLQSVTTYELKADFDDFYQKTGAVIDEIQRDDQGFYRLEKNFQRSKNDAMLLKYRGLTHNSLKDQRSVKTLMQRMGFRNYYQYWAQYGDGSTMTADALFGVKYVVAKDWFSHQAEYEAVRRSGDMTVYLNPYALPLAFMADRHIVSQSADVSNPFELQNQIYGALSGNGDALYYPVPVLETRLENVTERREADVMIFTKTDQGQKGTVEYLLQTDNRRPVYAFFPSGSLKEVRIYVNGEDRGPYFTMNAYDVVGLGSFGEGGVVSFKFELREESVRFNESWFYYLDLDRFAPVYRELERGGFQLEAWSDTRITGTAEATPDKGVLFTSIPWDRGWQVRVDGQPAETVLLLDALMGVALPPGTHRVELRYHVPGLAPGLVISVLSLAASAADGFRRKRRAKKTAPSGGPHLSL
jgi:uncharacterized membrane protein YfhO